ncbi:glycoside hydrolase family 75 protein [Prosthecobacter sp.]|uniref:glycoside hydrolase family 75 protein n=1 Tax=Prosthecobacter sp. TaxID=1965333 RepID=UPI002ABA5D2E|nr:glycoside hydrolase family 75 protein [Prosthecobacter sp.]MDZ4405050.1 glycoside hydrolase family 75 protein [Prosthecobacter sp.]
MSSEPSHTSAETDNNPPPSQWRQQPKRGCFSSFARLLLLLIILTGLLLPFTPFASKIKKGIQDIVESARSTKERIITRDVTRDVIKEVPVVKEVTKEVIKEVHPPLPDKYISRKDIDVATLFNGITVKTNLLTEQGSFASLERLDPESYKAEFQLSIRVPKANQTMVELSRINKHLPAILPGLDAMLPAAKVSGFYHKLYENKTSRVQNDLTRLNKILDRHNYYDTETILELTHPTTQRRTLLIQSEMDVVADGSDGDRMPTLSEYIYLSDYYQPFTSYAWAKTTKNPNPLLAKWEERLKKAQDEFALKGLSSARNRELSAIISTLKVEISEMKARSSLIAEKDPFVVISLLFRGYGDQNKFTPQIGDYAAVIHEGRIYPAICGDYGPSFKMGEASLLMAKTVNPKATPYIRPESDLKVTYLIFPGTAEKERSAPDLAKWREKCQTLLGEVGGIGSGYVLHTWEDPFKKPEPPATAPADGTSPTSTPTTAPAVTPGTTVPATPITPSATPDPTVPATSKSGEAKATTKAAPTKSSGTKSKETKKK